MNLDKLAGKLKVGYIESNNTVGFPQIQSVTFGPDGYLLNYEWNKEKGFLILTISKSNKVIFKSRIVEGGKYIVHSPKNLFELTGIKTICVLYPITVDEKGCIIRAYWQEEE